MSELKPCPFCGGSDNYPPRVIKLYVPWADLAYTVECDNCQASCGYENSEDDAIINWNTRNESTNWL